MNTPAARGMDELPAYRVVCLETDAGAEADGHQHVTAIETWDPHGGRRRWTLVQVIAAIRDAEVFRAGKDGDGRHTTLEPAVCPRCQYATLLVDPAEARPPACS